MEVLWNSGISPGSKGRNGICRRLLRRMLDHVGPEDKFVFQSWLDYERELRSEKLNKAKRCWKRFKNRTPEFWYSTFGVMPEELKYLH